jgi:hypothetical protein
LIHLTRGRVNVYVALLPGNDGSGDRHVPMLVPVDEVYRFRYNTDGAFCILNHKPNTDAPPTWQCAEDGQSLIAGLQFEVRARVSLSLSLSLSLSVSVCSVLSVQCLLTRSVCMP